jgi:anti-sigma factor RsiW
MQHPDEGTIHAWLDGELPEDQANEIAAHASDCPECSALVAEARGLIAASTRILTALDNVPAGVIPEEAAQLPAPARRRRWYNRTDIRAAAALLIVAGVSFLVVQRDSGASRETLMVTDKVQPVPAPVANRAAVEPSVAAPLAASPAASPAAEPMTATPPPAVSSIAGTVKVTSKRSKAADSAYFLGERSAAGAARPVEPAFGMVEGQVIDKSNDKGLASAQVILRGTSLGALTDKDGRFSITNIPVGEQHLTVRRIGYQQQNIALAVSDDASVTVNVVLTPQMTSLSEAVVTGVATTGNVASLSLRVLSVDSATTTRRTVYEISQGVGVTLAESPVNAGKEERDFSAQLKSSAQASAKVAQSMIAAAAPAPVINTISWAEHGRRYTLSGPLTIDELQALKVRLMLMRR